ncbi:DUF202 domain-containing protein [Microbacterium sp. C5A9]|uniref:DUF202 domain-containing protein n=1 Tax=Microbacterium sp. C5A9 TaxID=2736663 RepID=UPI001F5259FC|nr:DUF202 domain-containing protein [Microbacterium sp. C5A9]MCI1018516.1 DUF202 domain-containing protein [Microbacterium sp. C5A9]
MPVFDPGLQPERTELAWRRTALALGIGSLVSMRILTAVLGDAAWVLCGVAGVLFSVWVWSMSQRRYREIDRRLRAHGDRAALPGARPLLVLAAVVGAAGMLGLVVVVAAGWTA